VTRRESQMAHPSPGAVQRRPSYSLPTGDLHFGSENVRVYIPITSMLLLSIVATLLVSLFRR
jgi:Protein of unknown function (DUF2905)